MSSIFYFPSYETIIAYLQTHPSTKGINKIEKKIIEVVAQLFADKESNLMSIDIGVMNSLYSLNIELKLKEPTLVSIHVNIVGALKDCASLFAQI